VSGPGEAGAKAEGEETATAGSGHARAGGQQRYRSSATLEEYSRLKKEMRAYRSLKSKGVSDLALLRWERIIAQSGLSPGAVQKELAKNASLLRVEAQTQARIGKARLALESIKAKNDELKRKYSTAWDSVMRYQLLREAGVDGSVIQRWERLIAGNGLDPERIEDELLEHKNLNGTKKELEGRLVDLGAELEAARERLRITEGEMAKLESQRTELLRSVDDITERFRNSLRIMTEDATQKLGGVETKAGEELQRISAEVQSNLRTELAATAGTVEGFRTKIEEAYASAFQTGQAIGRNEALKPLVRFVETREGTPGEVVPLMSLLAHSLAKWAEGSDPALAAKARDLEEYLNGKLRGI
jgi:AraC-like DNA-binding protein